MTLVYLNSFIFFCLDGLRDRGSTGLYLFERNAKKIGDGAKVVNEGAADWDPEFKKGLAIVLPNDLPVKTFEVHSRKDKLHFSGIKNRVKKTNVIYQRSEKKGTDHRYIAYIYFRVIFKKMKSENDGPTVSLKKVEADRSESTMGGTESSTWGGRGDADAYGRGRVVGNDGEEMGTQSSSYCTNEGMDEFIPLCQSIAQRLKDRDDRTKTEFLSLLSGIIFDSGSRKSSTSTEFPNITRQNQLDRRRKAEECTLDEGATDSHRKARLH